MEFDDILESSTYFQEVWPQVRPFGHKNNFRVPLDAWVNEYNPLLLNKLDFL